MYKRESKKVDEIQQVVSCVILSGFFEHHFIVAYILLPHLNTKRNLGFDDNEVKRWQTYVRIAWQSR
ncbi:hypothetical protein [Paracerasibacillus soli]|uniref:Uncharacterized protein n=1 Tax=Paracerasibacillus soli TaxID=480284 RepID=A0ABU5CPD3_9BACI|nr:hypothetical protein [Virgibacillus soli]MDY0408196.1 hypothetical protein [Virgibacillus soli]